MGIGSTAGSLTSAATGILQSFAAALPNFFGLLLSLSMLFGLVLCGYSLYKVVDQQKHGESIAGPAMGFMLGVGLVNLAAFVTAGTDTVGFSDTNLTLFSYSASSGGTSGALGGTLPAILVVLKFFGWLACFRAFILWSESTKSGSQPGTVWRGATHFVSGILLINMNQLLSEFGGALMGST